MNSIQQNQEKHRFEMITDNVVSFVEYNLFENGIVFSHTEVPKALEGKGIASALAKHVLEFAAENKLKVVPVCPFIRAYILRHQEYQELVN